MRNHATISRQHIAMKSETIMTIVETAKGRELTSDEITIIDRCVKFAYQKYIQTNGDERFLPTFEDFYNLLLSAPESEAHSLAVTLEIYVKGSFNIFSGRTNIDTGTATSLQSTLMPSAQKD